MKIQNNFDLWLEKVTEITQKILEIVRKNEIPDKKDLDNRERLINLMKEIPGQKLNFEQLKHINAILDHDKEIIIKLEEVSLSIQKEIRQTFLNREAISKFNLREL